jgi:hypothetical protein
MHIATNYHAGGRNKKQFIIIVLKLLRTFTGLKKSRSGQNCTKLKEIFSNSVINVMNPYYCYLIIRVIRDCRNQYFVNI